QKCVAETVQRFGGFVAKYIGDGVLIYFGYPQAHEDDAERAVRSGLELVAAVGALKTHAPLQTRVGIATGGYRSDSKIVARASPTRTTQQNKHQTTSRQSAITVSGRVSEPAQGWKTALALTPTDRSNPMVVGYRIPSSRVMYDQQVSA